MPVTLLQDSKDHEWAGFVATSLCALDALASSLVVLYILSKLFIYCTWSWSSFHHLIYATPSGSDAQLAR